MTRTDIIIKFHGTPPQLFSAHKISDCPSMGVVLSRQGCFGMANALRVARPHRRHPRAHPASRPVRAIDERGRPCRHPAGRRHAVTGAGLAHHGAPALLDRPGL